jgi:hypothetical protein
MAYRRKSSTRRRRSTARRSYSRVRSNVRRGQRTRRSGSQTVRIVVQHQPASPTGIQSDPNGEVMGLVPQAPRKAKF